MRHHPPVARLPRDFHTAWAKTRIMHCNKKIGEPLACAHAPGTPTDTAKAVGDGGRYSLRFPKRLVDLGVNVAIIRNIFALIKTEARQSRRERLRRRH